ncbi:hypothetical protein P3T76_004918 [Phytophthora citrophthora]|uniref:Uncharacterized protein n=1 Tax=Phytophthora citrophthora TaxID=4793 RepID=A0AAD9LQB5_9STRA|nr:hypothetical protein P3T76_004918 [Phytophthora citrophthora]
MALGYWATIIQRGAAVTDKPPHLVCLESIAIAVVWTFQVLYDMCLFLSKGFNPQGLVYMQLTVSACMLGIISTVFLIYGLRVLSRLQQYERQLKLRMPSMQSDRMVSNRSFDLNMSDDEDGTPVMRDRKVRPRPQEGHASKIKKILFVVETCSLVVVAAQMYMAIDRTSDTPVELSCANGHLCDTVKCSVNLLHIFQVGFIILSKQSVAHPSNACCACTDHVHLGDPLDVPQDPKESSRPAATRCRVSWGRNS